MAVEGRMDSGHGPGSELIPALCDGCGTNLDPGGNTPGPDGRLPEGTAEFFYMVTDQVWTSVGMATWDYGDTRHEDDEGRRWLCVGCLEQRLGRELRGKDFTPGHPVNWPQAQDTARLADRKSRIIHAPGTSFFGDLARSYADTARRVPADQSAFYEAQARVFAVAARVGQAPARSAPSAPVDGLRPRPMTRRKPRRRT